MVAPKKNPESHREKKVAPKNEEKQLRPPRKKTVSLRKKKSHQRKRVAPPPSPPQKTDSPRKKSHANNIYPYAYVCGTNICLLIRASKDLIYALKSKVRESVWCLVHSNLASFLVSFHGWFLVPEINFEFCNSRADRVYKTTLVLYCRCAMTERPSRFLADK